MKLEGLLARRYLGSKGSGLSVITWIALAGVIVGVMSLVTVMAVMSGFDRELRTKILGNNAHIIMQLEERGPDDAKTMQNVLARLAKNPRVASAMPVVYGEGFLLSPSGESEGAMFKGVDPQLVQKVLDLKDYVRYGNWQDFKDSGVILGDTLAQKLGLEIGDSFTLVLNRGEFSPLGLMPKMKKLKLIDTFHSGMTQYDGRHGYLQLDFAAQLFEVRPRTVEIRAKDIQDISKLRDQLRRDFPEAGLVQDWVSLNSDFLSALQLEKTAMSVILGLIILVASFNICGSLIMIVRDKTKDIAILKSMGAYDQSVLKIFFYQGIFIGGVGTFFGLVLGIVLSLLLKDVIKFPLSQDVYMIDTLPVDIRWSDWLIVAVGALLISSIATLYPARMAAKINPTEGLKAD